jgi:hypothetical protein
MGTKLIAACLLLESALAQGPERSITTPGVVRELTPTKLTIRTDDQRIVWFRLRDSTLAANAAFGVGDRIQVTSFTDDQEPYVATWMQRISSQPPTQTQAPSAPPLRIPEDAAISRARKATTQFVAALPSFQVRRVITRYGKQSYLARWPKWEAIDVVTSTLAYKNGGEAYSDIRVGPNEFKQLLEEMEGLSSTGEFGQLLLGIFNPKSATRFGKPRRVELSGRECNRYPFFIRQEDSTWLISARSEQYFPAYAGALWIDRETSRVLRVEMQARELPRAFPLDSVEMTVDYGFVKLEAGDSFLLPTASEALSCQRRTNSCLKNATVFTDYVKFEAESKIIFEAPK